MEPNIGLKPPSQARYMKRQPSDLKASRVSLKLVKQSSRFFGNISLIKVNIKTVNQVTNLLPLENDTLGTIRDRLFVFFEKTSSYSITSQMKDSFVFQLDKDHLSKADEKLSLEELLKERWRGNEQVFQGDVLHINFFIPDVDMEYQLIKDNLDKIKSSSVVMIFLVKQYRAHKNKMKNMLLKVEENAENCLLTVYTTKGDLKEAFAIESLKTDSIADMKINQVIYYPVIISKALEYSTDHEESTVAEEKVYFVSEKERSDFLQNISTIQSIQNRSQEDIEDDNLIGSIQALGSFESDDLDEEIEIGKLTHRATLLTIRGGGGRMRMSDPGYRISLPPTVKTDDYQKTEEYHKTTEDYQKTEEERDQVEDLTLEDNLPPIKLKKEMSTSSRKNICKAKRMSVFAKLENQKRTSVISKVMLEKKELELDTHEFEVKMKGMFGISQKRILRLSEDFEFHFFKKEKEKYIFTQSVPISSIAKISPKEPGSNKVYVFLKDDKKLQKPLRMVFRNAQDLEEFIRVSKKISELFNTSTNSFHTEKARATSEKVYPWLMGPKDAITNVEYDQGKLVTMQFNVINLSQSQEPQVVHLDLVTSVLSLTSANGTVKKKLNIRNINYCELLFKDTRGLSIVLKNKKYKLLFSDNKNRSMFESAVYNTILPQFRIPSKKPFEWETFNVFCTTFNAGFGTPPADLSPWLEKTHECDIIAIGMQEADTAEWLQAIQEYYFSEKFSLVALVTMWKMLICVFVSAKYADYVTNVEVDSKATGIAKVIGNKGGVALSFRIFESSFCFLSTHLAAQPERMPTRKADFYNLMKNIRLGDETLEACGMYDYFFFMGDTNFRLDYDFFKAVDIISRDEHVSLLPHDQYAKARDDDNFMTIFKEGKITFKPTYRRIRDNPGYSNKRNQCPSWTDRIFVKSRPAHPVAIKEYDSAEMFFLSDHRPVYGIYQCEIQPPYLPRVPMYARPTDQQGIIKLSDLELSYDFELYKKMSDFELPLNFPSLISLGFRGKFLQKAAFTVPVELRSCPSTSITWNEEMLPFLYCIVPDYRFLRTKNLLTVVQLAPKEKPTEEVVIGQSDVSLENLIINGGAKTEFESPLYLYGRVFGTIKGNLIYNLS